MNTIQSPPTSTAEKRHGNGAKHRQTWSIPNGLFLNFLYLFLLFLTFFRASGQFPYTKKLPFHLAEKTRLNKVSKPTHQYIVSSRKSQLVPVAQGSSQPATALAASPTTSQGIHAHANQQVAQEVARAPPSSEQVLRFLFQSIFNLWYVSSNFFLLLHVLIIQRSFLDTTNNARPAGSSCNMGLPGTHAKRATYTSIIPSTLQPIPHTPATAAASYHPPCQYQRQRFSSCRPYIHIIFLTNHRSPATF
jgi:hypothetical protein